MVGRQEWDGTVSGEQFKTAALHLVQRWQELCPGNSEQWQWQDAPSSLGASAVARSDGAGGYLVLENVAIPGARLSEETDAIPESHAVETTSYKDEATVLDDTIDDCHIYTFHIVYSESYRVPVMFLRGCLSDGSPLSWDQMSRDLPTMHDNSEKSRWTFVTQQEHPYLHRPWFSLHPCGTAALLALVLGDTPTTTIPDQEAVQSSRAASSGEHRESLYLATWLSVVGPILGLKVPLSCFKQV